MNSIDANELMAKLLDAQREKDESFVASYNLPTGVLFLLRRLTGIDQEIRSMERLIERRQDEERAVQRALQAELQRLP